MEKAEDFDMAVHDMIKEYMTAHCRIIFNGNGYSEEWAKEAERRGLPNIPSMIGAASALTTDKAVKLKSSTSSPALNWNPEKRLYMKPMQRALISKR